MQQVATQAELEQIISNSGDALVVVDFSASWCSPCQKIAPDFEQLSQELTDVVFLKVDVDENEVSYHGKDGGCANVNVLRPQVGSDSIQ